VKSDSAVSFVIAILGLQVVATALMWYLDVLSTLSTEVFAILLAASLLGFAIVLQVYRTPEMVERTSGPSSSPAAQAPVASPASAPAAAPAPASMSVAVTQTTSAAPALSTPPSGNALPRMIHYVIPIASVLLVLAFAVTPFLPADKSTLPAESTLLFIPVYLAIVIILVFASMYLFKRLMDTEETPEAR
jgi:hypothetical protein